MADNLEENPSSLSKVVCAIILLLSILLAIPISAPLIRPMWAGLKSVERDCVQTTPEKRTEAQRKNCARAHQPAGLIIPGLL